MYEYLTDSLGNISPDPVLDYAFDFLNIYFMQGLEGPNYGFFTISSAIVSSYVPIQTLVHEIGHLLGLGHTHSGPINPNLPQSWNCLCKDSAVINPTTQIPHCRTTEDCLCDTGIDPWALDIDFPKDGLPDKSKWVLNGQQISSLYPNFPDWCNDVTTPWNIPASNYMSYYDFEYRKDFTPCQQALMHDVLDSLINEVIVECGAGDPYLICDDIIINTPVVWQDTTLLLCRNQRIVIEKSGSLTLVNTTLSVGEAPGSPSAQCPDLVPQNFWDGIYIEGKSVSVNSQQQPVVFGILNVLNGSVIEFAENGINAPIRFGRITIDNSTIQKCGKILDVRDVWPFCFPDEEGGSFYYNDATDSDLASCGWSSDNPPPSVRITNSTISCDALDLSSIRPLSQIKVSGSQLYINNSSITNLTGIDLAAINQSRGRTSIVNGSKIEGFNLGVIKGADIFTPCVSRGLSIMESTISDCAIAVENTSAFLSLQKNHIEGKLSTNGLCYQSIYGNKFINSNIQTTSPIESSIYRENFFDNSPVNIYLNNSKTVLECNIWNGDYAVDILNGPMNDPTKLPLSWGSADEASGNKRTISFQPIMSNYEQFQSNFPHYTRDLAAEQFQYVGKIEGRTTTFSRLCSYAEFPTIPPAQNPNWIDHLVDIDQMESSYDSLENIINQLEYDYSLLTGQPAQSKLEVIQQKKIVLGGVVGETLQFMNITDSLDAITWLNRSNPRVEGLSSLYSHWYRQNFGDMLTTLQSASSDDAEVLYDVVSWMEGRASPVINIFSLNPNELDTLKVWATSSFGDYTNLLRSFLLSEYDIHIPWPEPILPRNSQVSYKPLKFNVNDYTINPNPSSGCIEIQQTSGKIGAVLVSIYNLNGQKIHTELIADGHPGCFSNITSGIYILHIQSQENQQPEMHLFVKI